MLSPVPWQPHFSIDPSRVIRYAPLMHTPIRIKLRVGIVLLMSLLVFFLIGWPAVKPAHQAQPLTILFHDAPIQVILKLAAVVLLVSILALVLAGPFRSQIAAVAVPAGLCVWAVLSQGIDSLLRANPSAADRTSMYYRFALEACIWFLAVLLGLFMARIAAGICPAPDANTDTAALKSAKTGLLKGFPLGNPSVRLLLAFLLSCAVAIVLLKVLARSGTAWHGLQSPTRVATAPAMKQAIFATATAFGLGVFGAHQLFNVRLTTFIPVPLVLAVLAYLNAARQATIQPLTDAAASFVPASSAFATILPLHYIAVGSLAVLAGYWFSVRAHRLRQHIGHRH